MTNFELHFQDTATVNTGFSDFLKMVLIAKKINFPTLTLKYINLPDYKQFNLQDIKQGLKERPISIREFTESKSIFLTGLTTKHYRNLVTVNHRLS